MEVKTSDQLEKGEEYVSRQISQPIPQVPRETTETPTQIIQRVGTSKGRTTT